MTKTRVERIADVQAKIATLKPHHDEVVAEMAKAQGELHEAERSYDDGERVRVTETCYRGCCIEDSYCGIVEGRNTNGGYKIRENGENTVHEYVFDTKMERLRGVE